MESARKEESRGDDAVKKAYAEEDAARKKKRQERLHEMRTGASVQWYRLEQGMPSNSPFGRSEGTGNGARANAESLFGQDKPVAR